MSISISGDGSITGVSTSYTFDKSVSIAGTVSYEDVTSIDAVGIITAQSGIHIDDSIVHLGDTNTKIRFPANDTITAETGGSERLRINSAGETILRINSASHQTFRFTTQGSNEAKLIMRDASDNEDIVLNTAGISYFNGGNVGINENNPNRKLVISQANSTAYSGTDFDQDYHVLKLNNTTDSKTVGMQFLIGSNGEAAITATETSDGATDLAFGTRGSGNRAERLRITSDGNMGLGAADPGADPAVGNAATVFEIRQTTTGNISSGSNRRGAVLRLKHEAQWENGYQASATDDLGRVEFVTGDGSTGEGVRSVIRCRNLQYYNDNALTFEVANSNSATLVERLRLHSNGNVQVKTDNVALYGSGTLKVNSGSSSGRLDLYGGSTNQGGEIQLYGGSNSDGIIVFRTGAGSGQQSERLRITSDGLVDISGGIQVSENVTPSSGSGVEIFKASSTVGQVQAFNRDSSAWMDFRLKGNQFEFSTAGTERLRITSAGQVSIGTDSPPSGPELTVRGPNPELSLYASANYSSYLMMGDTDDYDNGYIEYDNQDANRFMRFATNGSTVMRLRSYHGTGNGFSPQVELADGVGLHINGTTGNAETDSVVYITKTNHNDWALKVDINNSNSSEYGAYTRAAPGSSYALGVNNSTSWTFRVAGNGTIYSTNTSVQSISDVRLKENIVDANSQWDDIKALRFRNYKWKEESGYADGKTYLGLIAQEVETTSPGLVEINVQDKEDKENGVPDPEHKNVKYSIVWMKAMKALQEAIGRIETLEAEVKTLQEAITKIETLEAEVAALKGS